MECSGTTGRQSSALQRAEHIAVLANPKDEISVSEMPKAEMAAAQMGVHLIPFVASAPAELRALEPSALSFLRVAQEAQ